MATKPICVAEFHDVFKESVSVSTTHNALEEGDICVYVRSHEDFLTFDPEDLNTVDPNAEFSVYIDDSTGNPALEIQYRPEEVAAE